jgi:hypothetical protein
MLWTSLPCSTWHLTLDAVRAWRPPKELAGPALIHAPAEWRAVTKAAGTWHGITLLLAGSESVAFSVEVSLGSQWRPVIRADH